MRRLFVALPLPEAIRDLLIDAMDDSPALRWVPDENLHLTLRFIGEVERPLAEDIARELQKVRSSCFDLSLAGTGYFDQRSGGSIWAGVEPKAPVAALAAKVDRACQAAGLEPEHRAYRPHITLARYGRSSKAEVEPFLRRHSDLRSEPFTVDRFCLFESRLSRHGAHYEPVADFPLD